MQATHRVKDYNNNTIGFIIDKHFYTTYSIINSISLIDNLQVQKNGVVRAKHKLPDVSYKNAVLMPLYKKLVQDNPFKRDIQKQLKAWKNNTSHKVLQLEGSRQIGKTTELRKFAYSNYEYIIFVDMSNDIYKFIDVVNNGCTPLEIEKYCRRAYLPTFINNKNTILIIDEIQNNSTVYNSIRTLNTELDCDIIVTGSYLGRILGKKEFFLPAGTIEYAHMFTLSFTEFCRVFNCEEKLKDIDLYGNGNSTDYDKLDSLYRVYLKIGGYPEVVKTYKSTKNINECYNIINKLLQTFKDESRVYFNNTRETEIFENVYREALKQMCTRVDTSGKHIIETITTLVKDSTKLVVNKNEIANAVIWLEYAGILSLCNLAVDGDMRKISEGRRVYFSDCGIASYLASKSMINQSSLTGLITETFVYNELHRLFKVPYSKSKVIEEEVCFSTYGQYELDFMIADKHKTVYGIEVKTKDGEPNSLRVYINKGFVDKGIVAKPSKGGHGDYYDTIPIYTVGCRFPYK
jgi:hypothetical protein